MIQKFGALTALGLALSLAALYWIDPVTTAGQTVLVGFVVAFVNAVGGLLWRDRTPPQH